MKQTVCIIARYKSVNMMDFKVREGTENMLPLNTIVFFFYFDEKPDSKQMAES